MFSQIKDDVWSGAGSNRRPSAFQVNRAERCADLRKRTSLTSGTALGGRCDIYASRVQYLVEVKRRRTPIVITGVKKSRTKSLTVADKLSTN
jgi:hypothetical protein